VFELINGVTGERLGQLYPNRDEPPSLSHDTSLAVKRSLTLSLGVTDAARINPITDRVLPYMIVGGTRYPLGRYMFTDDTRLISTGGTRGSLKLLDEGNAIDQELSNTFTSRSTVMVSVVDLVTQVTFISTDVEPSPFVAIGAWSSGQTRGQPLDAYTTQGDYFPYWMANDGKFRMIRTKDPAVEIPDIDYDTVKAVRRDSIAKTSDVLQAPNRFIVIGNSSAASASALVGMYDVPPSAPHSIASRGFVIPQTTNTQVATINQAQAMAKNLGIRQTIYERITFESLNDPRFDSYNIIHFLGDNWLDLSWTMTLAPGGLTQHTARKAYL
jgi:hypothetical protein